jgi:hypothetical protein
MDFNRGFRGLILAYTKWRPAAGKVLLVPWLGACLAASAGAQGYLISQLWVDTNTNQAGSDLQSGGNNRSLAYSVTASQLFLANRGGTAAGITVLNPTNGNVIGTVNGSASINPDQILVGDDGTLYAIPLDTSLATTSFAIYSWTNWNYAPYRCYTPTGSDATSLGLISPLRGGDTAAITGAGTNTLILCGIYQSAGVPTTTNALLFSTTDGVNFTPTLLVITNLPANSSYSDLGPAHGYSFYTNGTFIFKPGGSSAYLIQYPTNFASLPSPVSVGAIGTNAVSGNSVVTDYSPAGHLLAGIQLPQPANNNSTISLYALTNFGGGNVASSSTPNPLANGNDTGGIVFGGAGKTNMLFTLASNNGVYGFSLTSTPYVETGVPTPAALQTALNGAPDGQVVSLSGLSPLSCPALAVSNYFSGGALIFSDSPESPTNTGILYEDATLAATGSGTPNRVFLYHVNSNATGMMKFSVLIKNNGAAPATLMLAQAGWSGPSSSYLYVGETAFQRWLTNTPRSTLTVAPGQTVRLDTNFDAVSVPKGDLMNGIWDYTMSQPHTVMVCALNPGDDPVAVGPTLPLLARDTHVRGTFAADNKTIASLAGSVINTTAGAQQFSIAGTSDPAVTGFDNSVSPPTAATDSGNYGVLYSFQLNTAASDGHALALLLNPRGGSWSGAVAGDPGILPGGDFLVPASGSLSANTSAAVAGEYYPNGGLTVHFQFMPTGAAALPVSLLTVPYAGTGPDLAAMGNYTINAGQTISFNALATTANGTPPLSFSLPVAPAGATIGSSSGVFTWRAPVASAGTTQQSQVRVTDSSSPALSDNQVFSVTVNPLTSVTVSAGSVNAGGFAVQAAGPAGPDYILQGTTNLANPTGWINLETNTPGTLPFTLTDPGATNFASRYYRVVLGP